MAAQRQRSPSIQHVPYSCCLVLARGGEARTVGTEGYAVHVARVPAQRQQFLTARGILYPHRGVLTWDREALAVGAKGDVVKTRQCP